MDNNNENRITVFAKTNFRGKELPFGIKTDDRRRHMYLIGKTGMGKTNALEHMIIADIKAGNGVAVVDPHGDFVRPAVYATVQSHSHPRTSVVVLRPRFAGAGVDHLDPGVVQGHGDDLRGVERQVHVKPARP